MLRKKSALALGTLGLALTLSFGLSSVQAAACKGLESGPCQRNTSCSWVEPYTRKSGVKVSGYCKSKPSKSSKSGGKKEETGKKKAKSKE